jgi:hypothetical protein
MACILLFLVATAKRMSMSCAKSTGRQDAPIISFDVIPNLVDVEVMAVMACGKI